MSHETGMMTQAQIEEMRAGARNAVRNCMAVGGEDRVFVLTDQATDAIGQVLYDAAEETGAATVVRRLEDYATRPITSLPESLRADLLSFGPTVTFYAASSQTGEVAFRMALRSFLVSDLHVRHGHMPGITYPLMVDGMRADYRTIAALTLRVYELCRTAHTIHVATPDGTDLTATFSPTLRWVPCTGLYSLAGQWGNLPEGEIFTCPADVNGTLVVHLLGDYFSAKYGVLESPLTIDIRGSHAVGLHCQAQEIADELGAYLDSAENGRRAGEFAIGTNVGLTQLVGNLLQDEKLPGLHIAFGNPYPRETGADWSSTVHVDVIATHCTIMVDGHTLMRDGQFDHSLLNAASPAA